MKHLPFKLLYWLIIACTAFLSGCNPTWQDKCYDNCEAESTACFAILHNTENDLSAAIRWAICSPEQCYRTCDAEARAYRAEQAAKASQSD